MTDQEMADAVEKVFRSELHKFKTPADCNCGLHSRPDCMVCDGGLAVCTVCNLLEGSLTTDCPGAPAWQDREEAIYAGELDYRAGEWVKLPSPHSPAGALLSVKAHLESNGIPYK